MNKPFFALIKYLRHNGVGSEMPLSYIFAPLETHYCFKNEEEYEQFLKGIKVPYKVLRTSKTHKNGYGDEVIE